MSDDILEPPAVPLCSKDLVAVLKKRLQEAVTDGKASDAKIFLDIIERLARLNWLDNLSYQERFDADKANRDQQALALHQQLYDFVEATNKNNDL